MLSVVVVVVVVDVDVENSDGHKTAARQAARCIEWGYMPEWRCTLSCFPELLT